MSTWAYLIGIAGGFGMGYSACRSIKALERAKANGFERREWWNGFFDAFAWTEGRERTP